MKRKAFTLIELLVVVSVMIILMAMMLPAIKSMSRNNAQKQTVNQLTSLIAHARTTAIQTGKMTGLVIYEDADVGGQTCVQLVARTSVIGDISQFGRVPGSSPQTLPKGVTVGMLDDNTSTPVRTSGSSSNTKARAILFDNMGQMVLINGMAKDPALTDAAAAAWNLNATVGNESRGVSNPGVVVFSDADMKAATDKGVITNSATRAAWVQQNADILVINAYTGSIIR